MCHVLQLFCSICMVPAVDSALQATGNYDWAYDKVAAVQGDCLFSVMTLNRRAESDPEKAIEDAYQEAQLVTAFACSPFDCSGNGECNNGNCVCYEG